MDCTEVAVVLFLKWVLNSRDSVNPAVLAQKLRSMKLRRPKYTIAALLGLTLCAAIVIAARTYPARQQARTKAIYDAQKDAVKVATDDFVAELIRAGYTVVDDSTGLGGSGEWRRHVALTATSADGAQEVCYVEVMGFVSHNDHDEPSWMQILPMRISHKGRKLNAQFIAGLLELLDEKGWEYNVDDRCRGDGWHRVNTSEFYSAS